MQRERAEELVFELCFFPSPHTRERGRGIAQKELLATAKTPWRNRCWPFHERLRETADPVAHTHLAAHSASQAGESQVPRPRATRASPPATRRRRHAALRHVRLLLLFLGYSETVYRHHKIGLLLGTCCRGVHPRRITRTQCRPLPITRTGRRTSWSCDIRLYRGCRVQKETRFLKSAIGFFFLFRYRGMGFCTDQGSRHRRCDVLQREKVLPLTVESRETTF